MLTFMEGKSFKINTLITAHKILVLILGVSILIAVYLVLSPKVAIAATITVNSKADTIVDEGACTLREAILSANNDSASGVTVGECSAGSGVDTISFNITGAPDFINGGQNGYIIAPTSSLPDIVTQMLINGYSQPGSQQNTTIAPEPLNARLLIEINGAAVNGILAGLYVKSDDVVIRGLVINRFGGDGISIGGDSLTIQGCFLGTDATGLIDRGNGLNGAAHGVDGSTNARIGGLNPEDRNLISGNEGGGSSPNTDSDGWVYQGNYIGVDITGLTAMPNAQPLGSGAISLDNSDNHVVGGSEQGAVNVIAGNRGHGIAPYNANNVRIEGNLIGVGYDGETPLGNGYEGITFGAESTNAQVLNNIIANNVYQGLGFYSNSNNALVIDNTITNNQKEGIAVLNSSNITIGQPGAGNNIVNNNSSGIVIFGFGATSTDNVIQSNIIDNYQADSLACNHGVSVVGSGVNTVIGGNSIAEGIVIKNASCAGVGVSKAIATAVSFSASPVNTSIISNRISNTRVNTNDIYGNNSLGIDLVEVTDTSPIPDGLYEEFAQLGPTPNDSSDADTGPNDYINFPVINNARQNLNKLNVNLNLDAADSPSSQYRVELFANDQADQSGYGEGQEFLGYTTIPTGNNQNITIDLPEGTDLTNKVLSATTTAIDTTTASGFGATSEFSLVADVDVLATKSNPNGSLANTGSTTTVLMMLAGVLMLTGSLYTWKLSGVVVYRLNG
jgi:CSLREA domain-containing protein